MTHSPHPVTGPSEISLPGPNPTQLQGPHPLTPGILKLLLCALLHLFFLSSDSFF